MARSRGRFSLAKTTRACINCMSPRSSMLLHNDFARLRRINENKKEPKTEN